jgi:hypothetical protein
VSSCDAIPRELRDRARWIIWRFEVREGQRTKVPYRAADPTRKASVTDPDSWGSFEQAVAVAGQAEGLGFVFTDEDDLLGVDLDGCYRDDGELHATAAAVLLGLRSYAERSPSGRGLHVILRGRLNGQRHRTSEAPWGGGLEVYEARRFFTFTGERVPGTPASVEECQAELDELLAELLPAPSPTGSTPLPAGATLELDDEELLTRARAAKHGADFDALYRGQHSYGSASEADQALCNRLAFWTAGDAARIDALFRASGLYREKWEREDYRQRTIENAIASCRGFYEPSRREAAQSARPNVTRSVDEPPGTEQAPDDSGETNAHLLEVLTAKALCELPDPSASDELLGPLVGRNRRTVIGAHTGEGKTTVTIALVRAIALKGSFLDWSGSGGRALVIDAEQGLKTIKRRLREAGLEECEDIDYVRAPDGLSLDSDERQVAAVEELLAVGDYVAVVADPLYKLHRGDSNEERAAVDLMRRFDAWRERYGFGFILPVHCRKPPVGAKFTMHEFFGSSAYLRGAEVVLGLQRVRDGYSRLHFFKDRDGDLPVGSAWGLLFDREQGFRRDPQEGEAKQTAADEVRELLEAQPGMSIAQLMKATGKAERTIRKALKEVEAHADRPGATADKLWSVDP